MNEAAPLSANSGTASSLQHGVHMPRDARTLPPPVHCENPDCARELVPGEPVHRTFTAWKGDKAIELAGIAYLCPDCGRIPEWLFARQSCEHCGRPVIQDKRPPPHVARSRY